MCACDEELRGESRLWTLQCEEILLQILKTKHKMVGVNHLTRLTVSRRQQLLQRWTWWVGDSVYACMYLMRIFLKPLNSHDCLVYVTNPPRMCCKCMFYLGISNRLIDIPITDVLQNRILRSRIKVVQSGHLFASSSPGTPTIAGYLISARAVPGTLCRQYLCPSCHITAPSLADKMVTYKNSFIINVPS